MLTALGTFEDDEAPPPLDVCVSVRLVFVVVVVGGGRDVAAIDLPGPCPCSDSSPKLLSSLSRPLPLPLPLMSSKRWKGCSWLLSAVAWGDKEVADEEEDDLWPPLLLLLLELEIAPLSFTTRWGWLELEVTALAGAEEVGGITPKDP